MDDTRLIDAVKAGDYGEAERLISAGVGLDQQDDQGWTPLNFAAGRGDLSLVKLLVENGAEVLKAGRDGRTPYAIALAAGRVPVVKYLKEIEDGSSGGEQSSPERQYCKAYCLGELKKYPDWGEHRTDWAKSEDGGGAVRLDNPFPDDKLVFIHQDFTVTESMWHNENVIFSRVDSAWKEFCATNLKFHVPDDLDLIVQKKA